MNLFQNCSTQENKVGLCPGHEVVIQRKPVLHKQSNVKAQQDSYSGDNNSNVGNPGDDRAEVARGHFVSHVTHVEREVWKVRNKE